MSASHNSYDAGASPSPRIVEPLADCASARAGGHSTPGAVATTVPGVLSRKAAMREAMRAAYARGLNMRQACEAVGVTVGTALYISGKYGIKPTADAIAATRGRKIKKPDNTARNADIVASLARGEPIQQIAARLGMTRGSVRRIATDTAKSKGTKPSLFTPEQDVEMLRMRAEGATQGMIAAVLGFKSTQIESRLRHLRRRTTKVSADKKRGANRVIVSVDVSLKERRCLCGCNKMFLSEGPGNRISPTCREVFGNRHTGAV